MHYLVKNRVQERLKNEIGTLKKLGVPFQVGLVYPNRYFFGMSNLGFQTIYRLLNEDPEVNCERFFLPDQDLWPYVSPGGLAGYEFGTTASQLDMIAFSISYQNDYLNVIPILDLLGIPRRTEQRNESHPLILAGGPAVTINPQPLAPVLDAIVIGEGEEVTKPILEVLKSSGNNSKKREALDKIEGIYVPSQFNPLEEIQIKPNGGFGLISGRPNGTEQKGRYIRRLVVQDPQKNLAKSEILTPDTEFRDMYLLEVQRGCQWGCRFCAAGFMYRYPRYDSLENLKKRISNGLKIRPKLGLIAGDLLGHEAISEILAYIDQQGGAFSPSSVRLNAFTPKIIHYLKKSGNRTIAIAPEAGSERLRLALNKTFTNEEIVHSAVQLAEGGIVNIKLYIMIGLPGEDEEDINELCDLTIKTRQALTRFAKKHRFMPSLTLSVSPFVPKPSTPLQYMPFAGSKVLKKKFHQIRRELLPQGHIRLSGESALNAYMETLLSRGDESCVELLEKISDASGPNFQLANSGQWKQILRQLSFNPDTFVTKALDPNTQMPWDFIDHGIKNSFYLRELDKFSRLKTTHFCLPEVCRSCGVC